MRKTLLSTLALGLLLFSATRSRADDPAAKPAAEAPKPLVVISFSGYDALVADLNLLGQLAQNPDMAKHLEGAINLFTQNKGLAGLDKARPWGAFVGVDFLLNPGMLFVPVTNLQDLLSALGPILGEPEDAGGGIWHVEKDRRSVFIKEQGGWAFIASSAQGLSNLPADPMALLNGLHEQYDLAVQINIQAIPAPFRDQAMDALRAGAQGSMQKLPNETDEQHAARKQAVMSQVDAFAKGLQQMQYLTLGWAIDATDKHAVLDIGATTVPGSTPTEPPPPPSKFAGFMLPDALVSAHLNGGGDVSQDERAQIAQAMQSLQEQLSKELDKSVGNRDPQLAAQVKKLVADVTTVMEATLDKGQFTAGFAVVGTGPITITAGGFVAEGAKLEQAIKDFVNGVKNRPGFPTVNFDVATYNGVRFHTLSVPTQGAEPGIKQMFGDTLTLTLGFGPESAFLAVGKDGQATIQRIMDESAKSTGDNLPPVKFSVALSRILTVAARQDQQNPILGMLAAGMAGSEKDHLNLLVESIPDGARMRFEMEEAVLKLIGSAAKLAAGFAGGGGQF